MGIQTDVLEVIVYGRRASTSHVRLWALPDSEAKRRLLQLKADNLDKHTIHSSGKDAWLTQHKSAHKRFNNRATKYVKDTLQALVSPSSVDQFDVQILWLQDARVAASQAAALLAPKRLPSSHPALTNWRLSSTLIRAAKTPSPSTST